MHFGHVALSNRKKNLVPIRTVFELTADSVDEGDEAKWVQVAKAGDYKGYDEGRTPFSFTKATFEQVQKNVRSHPAFQAGADGFGSADVIPWDFDHGSERDPASGSYLLVGAPAHGWTRDIDVRTGADGKAELWALTRFLEPAKTFVKNGQYKWASVSLVFDSIHPVTGERTGALLTSIALTNRPFIEGMSQLAASRSFYFNPAGSASEAVHCLIELFGLPALATPQDVGGQLNKLATMIQADTEPLGVDLDDIVGYMRTIFGLPTLTPTEDVLREAGKSVQALIDQSAPAMVPAARAAKERPMELLKLLASKLGVREAEDTVMSAIAELIELRNALVALFVLERDTTKTIVEAAKANFERGVKLDKLIAAVGAKDVDSAILSIADLVTAKAELAKVQPELLQLRKTQEEAEEAEITSDVNVAMASRGFGEEMRPMLTLSRKTNKDEFLKTFPADAPAAKQQSTVLTRSVAATPKGTQLKVGPNGQILRSVPNEAPAVSGQLDGKPVTLGSYKGANDSQRMIAHLTATRPGFDKLKWEDQCEAAFKALEQMKASA